MAAMRPKQLIVGIGVSALIVFGLIFFWEFYLEDMIGPALFPDHQADESRKRWEFVVLSLLSALIAMAILTGICFRIAAWSTHAETALKESEERFRDLIDGSVLSSIIRSKTGKRLYVNQAYLDLFGYDTAAEVLAIDRVAASAAPHETERMLRYRNARLRGEYAPFVYEFDGQRKDGSIIRIQNLERDLVWEGQDAIQTTYIDITERDAAERALRQSERRYRNLIDGSIMPIQISGEQGTRLYVNQAFLDLFGYDSMAEVIGLEKRGVLIAPHDRKRIIERGDARLRGEKVPSIYEYDGLQKDGSIVPIQVFARRVFWDGHEAIQRTFVDISERKAAEQALRESEERFRDLIEGSLLAVQIVSDNGNRLYVNQAFLDFFGYDTKEEAYSQESGAFIAPYERGRIGRWREALRTGEPASLVYEFDARRKDGSIFPAQVYARSIEWEGETAHQRTYIDLTEQKKAEEALRSREAQLRLVTDTMPAMVGYIDRDQIIRFANKPYAARHCLDRDEIIGKCMADIWDADTYRELRPLVEKTLAGEVTTNEGDRVYADGKVRHHRTVRGPHFGDDGEVLGYFLIIQDITEHHQREEQLRHAQKMEAVGQLTGGVAHDFNNLLTVVLGNLDLLLRRLKDHESRELARKSMTSAQHGAELIQRLLAFSRKQALAPKVIDLSDLVAGMTDLMGRTLGEAIEIEVVNGADLWRSKADPGQLENALLNLAINGRDAMPQGGTLTIETANIGFDGAQPATGNGALSGEYVMVAVSDTGTGMAREVAERAFEPFFTTKDVGEGSGLGLSMVYGFIKQSGGHVAIETEEGVGTTVKLYLARSFETYQPVLLDVVEDEPPAHGERILVVEDDPFVRAFTVNLLDDLGYDIVEAEDGEEAIAALQHTPAIDLLLTDVVLPGGVSGKDVAVEASRCNPAIKVVYVSGYTDDVLARYGRIEGEVQLLNKPFQRGDLARKLRAVLDPAPV